MAQSDNIVSFNPGERRIALDDDVRMAVGECRRTVERTLPNLMNGLFEKLDDALYELADKSESNKLQTTYFDAMREVRKHRSDVQQDFLRGVLREFDQFWATGPRTVPLEPPDGLDPDSDLALVDEDELEESLAVTNLVSKGENRYQREVFALGQRFSQMLSGQEVSVSSNPLGPAAICRHFREAGRGMQVDIPVRLVIYKLFDKQVMNAIGGLYEEVNALLGHAGFVPKAVPRMRRGPPPAPPRPGKPPRAAGPRGDPGAPLVGGRGYAGGYGPDAGGDGGRGPGGGYPGYADYPGDGEFGGDEGDAQAGFFHTLQQLLHHYRPEDGGYGLPPGVPVVATNELVGALSQLQRANIAYYAHADGAVPPRMDLRHRLKAELDLEQDGKTARALGKADEDTLDVISMLFEFILDDHNLPDAMKALISRLQIPMLKVAILDKTFFSRKLHPARRLLNNLAHAAVGWTDDNDRSEQGLYGRIESIVNRIVTEFGEDPALFVKLNDEFTAYVEREQRGAEIAEERTNQVTRGKEQLKAAKQLVGDEIDQRFARHPHVPDVAREILNEGWKDVLLLTYLRQGPESEIWRRQLDAVDRLLWSLEPKSRYAERQDMLRHIPELLRGLREGLNGISYDQHKMARMFKELQACHIACLRGGGGGEAPAAPAPAAPPAPTHARAGVDGPARGDPDSVTLGDQPPDSDDVHDSYTELAEHLTAGTWLELQEEDGQRVRIKLSWKSDVSDAYVFVNRKGVKVLEMTMQGVAMLLRRGVASVLEGVETPLMDRALDNLLRALKKTEPGPG